MLSHDYASFTVNRSTILEYFSHIILHLIVIPTELNCLYLNVSLIQLFVNQNKSFRKDQPNILAF